MVIFSKKLFFVLALVLFPSALAVTMVTVSIQKGDAYTNDSTPELKMTADTNSDLNPQMSFSCNGTDFSAPVAFATTYDQFQINLTTNGCTTSDGSKTVYVKVTDTDVPNDVVGQDEITLDTVAPVTTYSVSPSSPDGENGFYRLNPAITLSCTDATSACQIKYHWNTDAEQTVSSPVTITAIEGMNAFSYYAVDAANNAENALTAALKVDTNVPVIASMALNPSNAYDFTNNSAAVPVRINGTSDIAACRLAMTANGVSNAAFFSYAVNSDVNFNWTTTGDGNYAVFGQCKDSAGNVSAAGSDVVGLDSQNPATPNLGFSEVLANQVSLHWDATSDMGNYPSGIEKFVVYKNTEQVATGFPPTQDYTVTGLGSNTTYTFRIEVFDKAGNRSLDEESTTTFAGENNGNNNSSGSRRDTVTPVISWLVPDEGAVVSGKVVLRVQVSDNDGIRGVRFYLDGTDISNLLQWITSVSSGPVEFEWDATAIGNGTHTLYATVDDFGGNSAQIQRMVVVNASTVVDHGAAVSPAAQAALDALNHAKAGQQQARHILLLAKQFGMNVSDSESIYNDGVVLMTGAQTAYNNNDYATVQEKSTAALQKWTEFENALSLRSDRVQLLGNPAEFDFSGIFSQSQLNPTLARFAQDVRATIGTKRNLVIFKQTDKDGKETFFLRVELSIKNNGAEAVNLLVVEPVPKVLAPSSDWLAADPNFLVLQTDPLVEWKVNAVQKGEERMVAYGIKKGFSKQELVALLESKELGSFKLAPLILNADASKDTPLLLAPSSILGFAGALSNPTLLAIILGIVVVLAGAFVWWKKNNDFGWHP